MVIAPPRQRLTPPALAKFWGVSVQKVREFIESGELRAFNAALRTDGRPRWRIAPEDVRAFEEARTPKRSA